MGKHVTEHTHHDTTVETLLTDGNDDVLAITFEDLGTRNHKAVGVGVGGVECMDVGTLALGLFPEHDAVVVADLLDGVRLSGRPGFVALDVVAGNEDAVAQNDLARLEEGDITDEEFLYVDDALDTGPDDLDATLLLLVVEDTDLPLLLPIIKRTNHDLWKCGLARGIWCHNRKTQTAMKMATMMATPSTQSTRGSPGT